MNKISSADVFRRRRLIFVDWGGFDGYFTIFTTSKRHLPKTVDDVFDII